MVKEILLSQGKVALVDDSVYDQVNKFKWFAFCSRPNTPNSTYYAIRTDRSTKIQHSVRMHRYIIRLVKGRPLLANETIDHVNHNGLDNRLDNLRFASPSENCQNRRIRSDPKSSQYKGVTWDKDSHKWRARIQIDSKEKGLGFFNKEKDAARAYDKAAREHFGEFAKCNFRQTWQHKQQAAQEA